jgi:hypothetical protein
VPLCSKIRATSGAANSLPHRNGNSVTSRVAKGRSYDDQYEWLMEKRDPKSSLEAEFLQQLYESKRRLPDRVNIALKRASRAKPISITNVMA